MSLLIPPINSKGTFSFDAPFDSKLVDNKEYTVKAVRTLKEMIDSSEDPFTHIYRENGLDETAYNDDLKKDIPIVIFVDGGGNYLYVPADAIKSLPVTTGVRYQEVMIGINLGMLPVSYSLDNLQKIIVDTVKNETGITSNAAPFLTSAVHLIDYEQDEKFKKLLEANKVNKQSTITMYKELLENYTSLQQRLKLLENYIKINMNPNNLP